MILKLLSGAAAALIRCVRPTSTVARILFVAVGVAMAFGGLGAARDGCPRAAGTLVAAGLFLATATLRLGGKHAATTAALLRKVMSAPPPLPALYHPKPTPLNPKSPASRLRSGWCQGALARDRGGRPVFPRESVAVVWSLLGAVAASHDSGTPEWAACFARLRHVFGIAPGAAPLTRLAKWNDDPSRTQAEVVAAAEAVEDVWQRG